MKLLNVNRNAKTIKNLKKGYLTGILYLAPSKILCPACSEGCRKSCLFSSGRGQMPSVYKPRQRKTRMFLERPEAFKEYLKADIQMLCAIAKDKNLKPSVRINGTSDIDVCRDLKEVLEAFPDVQFYDYTKRIDVLFKERPDNYYLCFSRSENTSEDFIVDLLTRGINVAIVFDEVPKEWKGVPVIDGDETDLRFLDPKGVIVGLKAKGKAKKDTTGFVIRMKGK